MEGVLLQFHIVYILILSAGLLDLWRRSLINSAVQPSPIIYLLLYSIQQDERTSLPFIVWNRELGLVAFWRGPHVHAASVRSGDRSRQPAPSSGSIRSASINRLHVLVSTHRSSDATPNPSKSICQWHQIHLCMCMNTCLREDFFHPFLSSFAQFRVVDRGTSRTKSLHI